MSGLNGVILFLFLIAAGWHSAHALDPSIQLSQYAHHAWTFRDGYFAGGHVTAISQTVDGYLWIGTSSGLSRFDGVRFVSFEAATGKHLQNERIASLLATKDGGLWIATLSGVLRWRNGELREYPAIHGIALKMIEDHSGVLWIAQIDSQGAEPVCSISNDRTTCFKRPDGASRDFVCCGSVAEAADGTIWAGSRSYLMGRRKDSITFDEIVALSPNDAVGAMTAGAGADLWVGIHPAAGDGRELHRLVNHALQDAHIPGFDASRLVIQSLFVDNVNSLWIGTRDAGLYRWVGDRVDHFDTADGLSNDGVYGMFADREGTVWIGTEGGIDSFHETAVTTFSAREGVAGTVGSVSMARDGGVWIGTHGGLYRLNGRTLSSIRAGKGLPGTEVMALLVDPTGRLWLGIDDTLWTYRQGQFTRIGRSDGTNLGVVSELAQDQEGSVWATSIGPPRTLFRLRDQQVVDAYTAPTLPAVRRVAADPQVGIWLGLLSGEFAHYQNGSLSVIPSTLRTKRINDIAVSEEGTVLVSTADGLLRRENGVEHLLNDKVGLPCNEVIGAVTDNEHNLWIDSSCALVEISSAELERWWKNSRSAVISRQFTTLDGFIGPNFPPQPIAKSTDGRLWFTPGGVLQMIDPHQLRGNSAAPAVHIESVIADRHQLSLQAALTLPPLTRTLEISYTALSLVVPQRVQFRYQLEGHDVDWQDAGTRRQAYYNDIPPGHYRFRVIACNNDGVWNKEGDAIDLNFAPAWYQTLWFRYAAILAALTVLWTAYRLRMRQISATLRLRYDERLDERTRLARDLHDTLLQTIQGSKLTVADALASSADAAGLRRYMERLDNWLARAVEEGRAALNALRYSRANTTDLAAALRLAFEESLVDGRMQSTFDVSGVPKTMQPVVRDEVYQIIYEAIRNACAHSRGTRLAVTVKYARDLVITVRDNGKGIESGILEHGKEDHHGLSGMRERAARIGAKLDISSSTQAGTEIVLTVPGRSLF